ncbi:MAG: ribosomal protein S18-alanine N-acetyltransferase [Acidimicrobiales bacterium]
MSAGDDIPSGPDGFDDWPEPVALARQDVVEALRIVPMRRRHLRSVIRIEEECYPRPWSATLFLSELAQRASRRYVTATIGPMVVGYAGLMLVEDEGHVTTVTVDPVWQHRGVGTMLLLDLARAAPRLGARHLTLEVRAGNAAAQELYRRFGFAPAGVRRNYYAETGEDAIVMWAHDVGTEEYADRLAGIEARLRSPR